MELTQTFAMIKPDGWRNGHTGNIIAAILEAGFAIQAMQMDQMTNTMAKAFYQVHRHRPFYLELCSFIASGPIVVMALQKKNAVLDFRALIGATNPVQAEKGTIRHTFGSSIDHNAIHGSDSQENAKLELSFFFAQKNLC